MSQCRDNTWQPIVHDIDRPEPNGAPFYVTEDLEFIKLRGNTAAEWIAHACDLIRKHGVRDRRGFTTCQEYTRIQCGCQRGLSEGNTTCARFLAGR